MNKGAEHQWGNPVPGAGKTKVCKLCGERKNQENTDPAHPASSCQGRPATGLAECVSDYEPFD